MKIIVIRNFARPYRGGNLNMKQLLNPIFFERTIKHPDSKRQRNRRLRAKELRQARAAKRNLTLFCAF
jgi:hypothetical protein